MSSRLDGIIQWFNKNGRNFEDFNTIIPKDLLIYDNVSRIIKKGDGENILTDLPIWLNLNDIDFISDKGEKMQDIVDEDVNKLVLIDTNGNYITQDISISDIEFLQRLANNLDQSPVVSSPDITGPTQEAYDTTISLTASNSLTAFKDNGATIVEYEWLLPDDTILTGSNINYTLPDISHIGETIIIRCRGVDSLGNKSKYKEHEVEIVESTNQPPTIIDCGILPGNEDVYESTTRQYFISATDENVNTLQFQLSCNDSNVLISEDNEEVVGNTKTKYYNITFPSYTQDTIISISSTVTDEDNLSDNAVDNITVKHTIDKLFTLHDNTYYSYFQDIVEVNNIVYVVGIGVEGAIASVKGEIYQLDKQNDTFTGKYIGYSSIKELFGVCKDTNDNIYVTGTSINPTSGGDNDILILKYDSNLNLIKAATYGDSLRNYGWKIKQLSNGNLAVCGYIYDTSTYKYKGILLVTDTDLNIIKDIIFNYDSNDYLKFENFDIDSNDNIYIVGYIKNTNNNYKAIIIKVSSDFNTITTKQFGDDSVTKDTTYYGISINDNDDIFISGYSLENNFVTICSSIFIYKLDTNLNKLNDVNFRADYASTYNYNPFVYLNDSIVYVVYNNTMNNDDIFIAKFNQSDLSLIKCKKTTKTNADRPCGLYVDDLYIYIASAFRNITSNKDEATLLRVNKALKTGTFSCSNFNLVYEDFNLELGPMTLPESSPVISTTVDTFVSTQYTTHSELTLNDSTLNKLIDTIE
jgi:hypothetical protein